MKSNLIPGSLRFKICGFILKVKCTSRRKRGELQVGFSCVKKQNPSGYYFNDTFATAWNTTFFWLLVTNNHHKSRLFVSPSLTSQSHSLNLEMSKNQALFMTCMHVWDCIAHRLVTWSVRSRWHMWKRWRSWAGWTLLPRRRQGRR